jgi:hypothetical protein
MAQETLGLRRQGFSPCFSLLIPAFSLVCAPRVAFRPRFNAQTTLPYPARNSEELHAALASVASLSPDHFRRRPA